MNYEDRYIIFLDILGFKNMVIDSGDRPNLLKKINEILGRIQKIKEERHSLFTESDRQISIFSDSIIISYDSTKSHIAYPILQDIIYLCIELSIKGIWMRGGISFGKLFHKGDKCFGPALINAANLESRHAKYARVVVDTDFLVAAISNPPKGFLKKDYKEGIMDLLKKDYSDNLYYLDFLDSILQDIEDPEDIEETLCIIKKNINQSLIDYKNSAQIFEKYEWMKNYYNETIENIYSKEILQNPENDLFIS